MIPVAEALTIDTFRPLVGHRFATMQEGTSVELALVQVRSLGEAHPPDGREPFALAFRGPATPVLPQATYRLDAQELAGLDIFIVPVARTAAATDYEAIFT